MMEDIVVPCLLGGEWLMKGCGEGGTEEAGMKHRLASCDKCSRVCRMW
jgi:hypothetical protein